MSITATDIAEVTWTDMAEVTWTDIAEVTWILRLRKRSSGERGQTGQGPLDKLRMAHSPHHAENWR